MTLSDTRVAVETTIPRPREAEQEHDAAPAAQPSASEPTPATPVAAYPWPEPWRYSRAARPRSEFWDVATAGWHSSGPHPAQRTS